MEYISGVVERITYVNEENGYSVIKIISNGYAELVTVVGNLASECRFYTKAERKLKFDSKFGKQFSVFDYRETVPATTSRIEKYLGSGLIKA